MGIQDETAQIGNPEWGSITKSESEESSLCLNLEEKTLCMNCLITYKDRRHYFH
jgi:hypothetical protein